MENNAESTPPVTPREPDRRPVLVFDLDGVLTPHPGSHPDSLYSRFTAPFPASGNWYLHAQTVADEHVQRVAARYVADHVQEAEAHELRQLIRDLAARDLRLLIASNNFARISWPYLNLLLGDVVQELDRAHSIFAFGDEDKIDALWKPGGPLEHAPFALIVEDDVANSKKFVRQAPMTIPVHALTLDSRGHRWLGNDGDARQWLRDKTRPGPRD